MEEVIGSIYTFALFGSFLLGVVVTFIGKSYLDSYIDNAAYAKSITHPEMLDENGQQVNTSGMGVSVTIVEHEIFEISPYRIYPVTEMIWGMTALIGCFGIVLILPLSLYLVAAAKSKKAAEINTINESE